MPGILLGLPRAVASDLIIQSAVGAALMLRDSGEHPVVAARGGHLARRHHDRGHPRAGEPRRAGGAAVRDRGRRAAVRGARRRAPLTPVRVRGGSGWRIPSPDVNSSCPRHAAARLPNNHQNQVGDPVASVPLVPLQCVEHERDCVRQVGKPGGVMRAERRCTMATGPDGRTAGEPEQAKYPAGAAPLSEMRFLTVAEVATLMRVSRMTVYRLVHSGGAAGGAGRSIVPGVRAGGARLPARSVQRRRLTSHPRSESPSARRRDHCRRSPDASQRLR